MPWHSKRRPSEDACPLENGVRLGTFRSLGKGGEHWLALQSLKLDQLGPGTVKMNRWQKVGFFLTSTGQHAIGRRLMWLISRVAKRLQWGQGGAHAHARMGTGGGGIGRHGGGEFGATAGFVILYRHTIGPNQQRAC